MENLLNGVNCNKSDHLGQKQIYLRGTIYVR